MPMQMIGGLPETALKNENGAAFTLPSRSRVDTQAIGLGATVETSSL